MTLWWDVQAVEMIGLVSTGLTGGTHRRKHVVVVPSGQAQEERHHMNEHMPYTVPYDFPPRFLGLLPLANFQGKNVAIFDIETERSAADCIVCGEAYDHVFHDRRFRGDMHPFQVIGWENPKRLGISVGCWYSYRDDMYHWFDQHTAFTTIQHWVNEQTMLVGFNSIQFDTAILCALAACKPGDNNDDGANTMSVCEQFRTMMQSSYDILDLIWKHPDCGTRIRGVNSLDGLLAANGLPPKSGHEELAPRLWRQKRCADVLNYCQRDVWLTKLLFEQLQICDGLLRREGADDLHLPILDPDTLTIAHPARRESL